ncbi:EamA family transporter [Anaerostipes sp.]|uniref:EamA family transporter n=1 Tax=Anaerostipes sp. TaxID=1872530 RepID=UPI0025C09B66|nr:EamA family transporter [Anaerostipes sp.]MBS7007277.1 EamA family transporter [Anaerostipes sp.]
MFNYIWPIGLIVFSNVVYQICAKSVPENMNPFASLIVTYLVGAAFSALMYFLMNKDGNLIHEFNKLNLAPFIFGIVLVGLEVGFIYAYKAGWQISVVSIVQSSFLAAALIFVGWLFYKEALTWNKLAGVIICLIGLLFINHK